MHNIARMGVSNAGAGSIPVRPTKRGGRQRHANPVLRIGRVKRTMRLRLTIVVLS